MSGSHFRHRDLTEGTVLSTMLKLAIPMMVGLFSVIMYNLIDTYFIARLGVKELAAITFTFPVTMFLGSLSIGLGIGVSSVVSRCLGSKQFDDAARLTTHALMMAFAVVVLLSAVGLMTIDPLFKTMGAPDDVLVHIREYMRIWYWGMMFLVVPMVGNNAIRAAGRPGFPAIVMMVAAGINALLAPLMIFGLWGFPRLEMEGAAYSTVISQFSAFCCSLYFLRYKLHLIGGALVKWHSFMADIKRILYIGLPSALTQIIQPVSMSVITWMIADYGKDTVAGFGVATRIEMVVFIPMIAIASSMTPFVGQNFGGERMDRIVDAIKKTTMLCFVMGALASTALFLWGDWLAAQFNPLPGVVDTAHNYFMIVTITAFFQALVYLLSATFNGMGKPKPAALAMIGRQIMIYIPLAFLFEYWMGLYGIFAAAAVANITVACVFYLWTHKTVSSRI